MSLLLQAKNISLTQGTKPLFHELNLSIAKGNRIGLVGHNGAGKTSLLRILCGQQQPDDGEMVYQRGLQIGLVEQFVTPALYDTALIDTAIDAIPEDERDVQHYRAETLLTDLGFSAADCAAPLRRLSGGQQNLALLVRAQLRDPDVLLMDEPGNHMDISALAHLRKYLLDGRDMTFMMISHDRELLDDCCQQTVFLRDMQTYKFDLPYSSARQELDLQDEQAAHRLQSEEKEITRIRKSAKRLADWGKTYDNEDLARKAKTMAARADKLEQNKTEISKGSGLDLALNSGDLRSKTVVTLENLKVSAEDDGRPLASCEYLVLKPGDRVAMLGINGAGKSTSIRRLLSAYAREAEIPSDDTVRYNPNVVLSYFDQELNGFENTAGRFDWLRKRVNLPDADVRNLLLHAGVAYEDFGQSVKTLSGGEKARLMFMLLALERPNFMILDEPTNHIDLESREQLEHQLNNSDAAMLVTSHDRLFLQHVCTRWWVIDGGVLQELPSLDACYERLTAASSADAARPSSTGKSVQDVQTYSGDDDIALERIAELEALLQADLGRKPKFQKPQRQAEWQAELDQLWTSLDEG